MAQPGKVYDENDEQPVRNPDLLRQEGYEPKDDVREGSAKGQSLGPSLLRKAESKKGGGAGIAGGVSGKPGAVEETTEASPTSKIQLLRGKLRLSESQKKKALIGGGATGGVIGAIILVFTAIIPLKIEHMVNNLENHFFASSHNALKKETDKIFENYAKRILKARKECVGGIITKGCAPSLFQNGTPVKNLYNAWHNGKLEDKLSSDYGIEFGYDKNKTQYYMKTPHMTNPEVDGKISDATVGVGTGTIDDSTDLFKDFSPVSRQALRDEVSASFQNETLWTRVNMRFKVGRLLEEKYGIRRCVVFCKAKDLKDDLVSKLSAQINAAKLSAIDRVITPRSKTLGDALKCLLVTDLITSTDGPKCSVLKTKTKDTCTDGVDCEAPGEPLSDQEVSLEGELSAEAANGELLAETTDEAVTLTAEESTIGDAGGLVADEIATEVAPEVAADIAPITEESSIPFADIIAAIQLARKSISFLEGLQTVSPQLKKWIYLTNSVSAVTMFNLYRSYSDEIKSGHANPVEVGSFVNSLGPGDQNSKTCKLSDMKTPCPSETEKGGTASAESTPAYQALVENQPISSTNSSFTDLLTPTAFADTTCSNGWPIPAGQTTCPPNVVDNSTYSSSDYKCNNNQPIPKGELVCPEEKLDSCDALNSLVVGKACLVFQYIHDFIKNDPVLQFMFTITDIYNKYIGVILDIFQSGFSWALGILAKIGSWACGISSVIVDEIAGFPFCEFNSAVASVEKAAVKAIFNFLAEWLLPNPVGLNMSGGRTFDVMASGADVSGNEYAHHGLGGVELTPQQSTAIINEQNNYDLRVFQQKPLFARIFDTTSDYSLISRVAVAMPTGLGLSTIQSTLASLLSNPLGLFTRGLASFIAPIKVSAATPTAFADPFGITQYGYLDQDIPANPDQYWQDNCQDYNPNAPGKFTSNYNNEANKSSNLDPSNMPTNKFDPTLPSDGTDPCLLIQAAAGSAGGIFDTQLGTPNSLLTKDDLYDSNASAPATPANKNIYIIGDTLSCGMRDSGNLAAGLTAAGWTVSKINCTAGITTGNSIPNLNADAALVKSSGTVIVELGINNCNLASGPPTCDSAGFQAQQSQMIAAINAINPTAIISWMNVYSAKSNVYQSINKVIVDQSSVLKYNVIDWATAAFSGGYTFDPALGVQPSDYTKMATWFSGQIGAPLALNNQPNIVAQALQSENPPKSTFFANIWNKVNVFSKTLFRPIKTLDTLWRLN
jgi:hypothetical protein